MKSYGITEQAIITDKVDLHLESILLKGYSIEKNVLSKEECNLYCSLLEKVCEQQEAEFGRELLSKINELDMARMPFLYERKFIDLFMHPLVLNLAERVLGKNFHLHLQNGIINKANQEHHQTSWHRDLPYQDWVISKPLGFNAFFCLTDFTHDNGATIVLPFSNKIDHFPSNQYVEENMVQVIAPAGSIIFFDSMIYHRASYNSSENTRYGLNNMFVVPIIKQQVDIPSAIEFELNDSEKQILGFNYQTPNSVVDFRNKRLNKAKLK